MIRNIKTVSKVESSQTEEKRPPKIVIIKTTEAFISKLLRSAVINGFILSCKDKYNPITIKIKNPLFSYKIFP